ANAPKSSCGLGSVKSNIGHLEAAAGIASLIKTVLALENGMLPPSLHFEQPNPQIDFDAGPFYVNARLSPWKNGTHPRLAGVSSHGIGGTNAHLILEEAPIPASFESRRPCHLITLSAKTPAALDAAARNTTQYLRDHPEINLADAAYTSHIGRRAFTHRRVLLCRDRIDAASTLIAAQEAHEQPVVFMFPGQGTQYAG